MTVEETLKDRGARYGEFAQHSLRSQKMLDIVRDSPGWEKMTPYMRQALSTIVDKIARICTGTPSYLDNWHDIQGYAKLVEDILIKEATVASSPEGMTSTELDKVVLNQGKVTVRSYLDSCGPLAGSA